MQRFSFYLRIHLLLISCMIARLEASLPISKFTIYKSRDAYTNESKYIVLFLGVESPVDRSHLDQIEAIKGLMDTKAGDLFLLPETNIDGAGLLFPAFFSPEEDFFESSDLRSLGCYAPAVGCSVSTKPINLLRKIRGDKELQLPFPVITELALFPIKKLTEDIKEINKKLESIGRDCPQDSALIDGLNLYLKFSELLKMDIERYENEIEALAKKEYEDLRDYLSAHYGNAEDMSQTKFLFYTYLALSCPDLDGLNIFKAILDNFDKSKLFIFLDELTNPEYLTWMLRGIGFEEVYTYTEPRVEHHLSIVTEMIKEFRSLMLGDTSGANLLENLDKITLYKMAASSIPLIPGEQLLYLGAAELVPELFKDSVEPSSRTFHISALMPELESITPQHIAPSSISRGKGKEKEKGVDSD